MHKYHLLSVSVICVSMFPFCGACALDVGKKENQASKNAPRSSAPDVLPVLDDWLITSAWGRIRTRIVFDHLVL